MFVLGLILILLSAGALVAVLASGADDQAVLYGGSLELPTLVVFLAGAAALLLFALGVELLRGGVKRANRNRKTAKQLRKLEKREELRRESRQDAATDTDPAATTAPDTRTDPGASTTNTGTTVDDRHDGPYQAPPPPSR